MYTRHIAIAVSIALLLPAGAVLAKNYKNDNPGKGHDGGPGTGIEIEASISFAPEETRLIRDYFATSPVETKPLPPGIAKNLARGKPLPPGIAKRYLPGDLNARLPVRSDYERLIAGDDVLLVSLATGVIVDILTDAL
ncbi:anti-virulence regulator CigR family protein [Parvibaculum sp.]|jgi:hypothetical protein|uniref:anti-virulence regulator CigR family protein n=1 Tax=Parvibaculum sp. TaxID=2024848 RepID=UPI001B21A91C|nr:anti-virulence regulator CigR family protein [Parvibaculum sp.]MBO6634447.1 hypothetical protein [Parvibaculum sp.]MBO6677085.1 hypothetical protein [Parvibaculum sp.]MBO6684217.1 hypothetical protein [Parvibaculum sp.]MBO6906224.1 hypothetical protein [Parvibaculum sp.]